MTYPWPGAFFLTDPDRVADPVSIVLTLPTGTGVIYRHFGAADRMKVAKALRDATYERQLPLLIANDPHLACQVRADGVHWPEAQAHGMHENGEAAFGCRPSPPIPVRALNEAVCEGVLVLCRLSIQKPERGDSLGCDTVSER